MKSSRILLGCLIASLCLLSGVPLATAAPFGDRGTAIPPIYIPGGLSAAVATIQQSDGKVVVVSNGDGPIGPTIIAARFTAAGVIDPTYGVDGVAYVDIPSDRASLSAIAAAIDASGNVIVVGIAYGNYPYDPNSGLVVAKLLPTGVPDPAFGTAGLLRPVIPGYETGITPADVAIDSLGRIIIGSEARDTAFALSSLLVIRLTPAGLFDTGFNSTGYYLLPLSQYTVALISVAMVPGDAIVVAGDSGDPQSNFPFVIARLTSAGVLDSAFGGTGIVRVPSGRSVGTDTGGKVYLSWVVNGAPDTMAVTRFTQAGAPDGSFGAAGTAQGSLGGLLINPNLRSLCVDSAGRVSLGVDGFSGTGNAVVVHRFTAAGNTDAGFGNAGNQIVSPGVYFNYAAPISVGLGDSLFLSGGDPVTFVAHLTPTGALDTAFNGTGTLATPLGVQALTMTGMVRQPDGNLVIAGYGDVFNSQAPSNFVVARLTLAGTLDTTFNGSGYRVIGIGDTGPRFNVIALDGTGRIVLASHDYTDNFRVVRLLSDGTPDASFNGTGMLVVPDLHSPNYLGGIGLAVDAPGNILLAGASVLRLTPTGAVDASFGSNGRAPMPVTFLTGPLRIAIVVDTFNRPLVGGSDYDGVNQSFAVARLTSAGSPDPTFGTNGKAIISLGAEFWGATVTSLAFDASGNIVLAGTGNSIGAAARVTAAGLLDPTFNGSGFNTFPAEFATPIAVAFDPLGRIIVTGGAYTNRLASNGAVDPTFNGLLPLATVIPPGSRPLFTTAVIADASGIYLAGTAGRAMAVTRLFDGAPTNLAILSVTGGGSGYATAAMPFDVIVRSQDEIGNPQPVMGATVVTISLVPGPATFLGPSPATCIIAPGNTVCTISGVAYPSSSFFQIRADVTSGNPLGFALSQQQYVPRTDPMVTITSDAPDPSNFGQSITVTASVSAPSALLLPSSYVNISVDGVFGCLFQLPSTSCVLTPNAAGTRTLVAHYVGDAIFNSAESPPVTHGVTPSQNPPVVVSAVSRKFHGSAGTFDLALTGSPLAPTVEPRADSWHTIVFTFDKQIIAATAALTEGNAWMGGSSISGNQVTVSLYFVADRQYVTVSLTNVGTIDGGAGGASVRVGFLVGDVNQNRVVTVSDLGLVNAQLAQPVTAANFLKDVNLNGVITVADKGITNANLANALPPP